MLLELYMRIKLLLSFFVLICLISCTENSELKNNDQLARDALSGVWRGEGKYQNEQDQGWVEYWKIIRHQDGTFEVQYLVIHKEDKFYEYANDTGQWFYENGSYSEINKNNQKSVYTVYSVKKDSFEYNLVQNETTTKISEIKTVAEYQLQDPPDGYKELKHEKESGH